MQGKAGERPVSALQSKHVMHVTLLDLLVWHCLLAETASSLKQSVKPRFSEGEPREPAGPDEFQTSKCDLLNWRYASKSTPTPRRQDDDSSSRRSQAVVRAGRPVRFLNSAKSSQSMHQTNCKSLIGPQKHGMIAGAGAVLAGARKAGRGSD